MLVPTARKPWIIPICPRCCSIGEHGQGLARGHDRRCRDRQLYCREQSPGVRAGMAYDISSANNSREHNDTNVLTLGAGLIGVNLAKQIVKVWLTTEFGGDRHTKRVDKIKSVERQYLK